MSAAERPIPEWTLERYLLGELPEPEAARIRAASGTDPELRARLAALERSTEDILSRHPPRVMAASIRERLDEGAPARTTRPARPLLLATALAGAASVAAATLLPLPGAREAWERDVVRVKGAAPRLLVFRQASSGGVEPLAQGSRVRARDLLQIAYQAGGRGYGVIVSVDGRGSVTRHLPRSGSQAAPLGQGVPVPLEEAYELDDAPSFERFHFVAADRPFAVHEVLDAARRARVSAPGAPGLDLPPRYVQSSVFLVKEPR